MFSVGSTTYRFSIFILLLLVQGCVGGGGDGGGGGSSTTPSGTVSSPSTVSNTNEPVANDTQLAPTLPVPSETQMTQTSPSLADDESDLALASEVIESVLEPVTTKTNIGFMDIAFDVTQGPTVFMPDPHALYFSYPRNQLLVWENSPFFVTEVDLLKGVSTRKKFLEDGVYLGQVSRYSIDADKKSVRLFTQNPVYVLDWNFEEKKGSIIQKFAEKGSVTDHFFHLAFDSTCFIQKTDILNLITLQGTEIVREEPLSLPEGHVYSDHVCDQNFVYLASKDSAGKFYLFTQMIKGESPVFSQVEGFSQVDALTVYFINKQLYVRKGLINPATTKMVYSYFTLNGPELLSIKALPKAPIAQTFEYKLFKEDGDLIDKLLPIAFRQTKPALMDWQEAKIDVAWRPVPASAVIKLDNNEIFFSGTKSLAKLSDSKPQKLGNPLGQLVKSIIKLENQYYFGGNTAFIYRYDPAREWTQGRANFFQLAADDPSHNPLIEIGLKGFNGVSVKKLLADENALIAAMTIVAKKSSSLIRHVPGDATEQGEVFNFDISDMLKLDQELFVSSYSDVSTQKSKIVTLDDQGNMQETIETGLPETTIVNLHGSPEPLMKELVIYHNHKSAGVLNLDSKQTQGLKAISLAPNKLVVLPNGHFLGISAGRVTLFRENDTSFESEALYDLKVAKITPVDFGMVQHNLFVSDKYGDIFKIELPISKILLK